MANIRNHCSWVHSDDWDVATRKAKDLVRMALGRVTTLKPLQRASIEVRQAALIIGGGPAGMNAGLTLAEQGFPVHIVEREPFLGGHLRDLYYTVDPTGQDDPQAYLQGLIAQVEDHPRIKLHLNAEVVESQGFGGDFSSIVKDKNGRTEEIEHGATIIATGGQEYRGKDYGFGDHPRVLSQQDLAHLLSRESAPPSADLEKTIDPSTLNQVVMLQCVGPAEEYCARICCATAFKNALQLKKANPSAEVIILHQDIRTYGFKERLYREALESGVLFVRYDQKHKPIVETEDRSQPLRIHIQDPNLAQPLRFEPDMLVLSMPVIPAEKHRELATVFKVPVDENGWFLEAHVKLRPVDFASEGIFLAGAAHYPKFLDEAIVQARAAASRAANILAQKTLRASGAIAQVDPGTCVGCLTCVRICPFDVPQIMPSSLGVGGIVGAAYIEPTACQGCGTCIGECPANAIELHHYQHEQLERQVLSLFIGKPLEEPA
jgi:heterodisulfide reductase subunit A